MKVTPELHQKGRWFFNHKTREIVSPDGTSVELTAKEQQFFSCIAEKKGAAVTRKVLMDELGYNFENEYGNRSLDVLLVRLRKKIKEKTGLVAPIKTVHGFGYSFSD